MKTIRNCLGLAIICAASCSAHAQTHCNAKEVAYFSCKIQGTPKVASLCGSKLPDAFNAKPEDGWLQYRFGVVGNPELIYPPALHSGSSAKFEGDHLYSRGLGIFHYSVMFENAGAKYVLAIGRADDGTYNYFVAASKGKRYKRFNCSGVPTAKEISNLGELTEVLKPQSTQ